MRLHLRQKQHHQMIDVQRDGNHYRVSLDGVEYAVEAEYLDPFTLVLTFDGQRHHVAIARRGRERLVSIAGESYVFAPDTAAAGHAVESAAPPEIVAPMPGKILQVLVQSGDAVAAGDPLLILEAMKMETRLAAEGAATVTEIRVSAGDMVDGGQVLAVLRYEPSATE